MPPELSAALTAVTLAVAVFLGVIIKRQLKNGKTLPPPAPAVTDTGSRTSIVALMGEQMAIHVKPITQRLDRIEHNQETSQATQNKRLGLLETAVARLDERTRAS